MNNKLVHCSIIMDHPHLSLSVSLSLPLFLSSSLPLSLKRLFWLALTYCWNIYNSGWHGRWLAKNLFPGCWTYIISLACWTVENGWQKGHENCLMCNSWFTEWWMATRITSDSEWLKNTPIGHETHLLDTGKGRKIMMKKCISILCDEFVL